MDKEKQHRILWTHNFPKKAGAGGVWMYNQHEYLKEDVDLYYLDKLRNPYWFIKHFFILRKLSKNYDIVHAQYGSAVGFLTSFTKPTKILSLKGSDWYKAPSPSLLHKIRIFVGTLFTKWSMRRFDQIVVMSDAMKQLVLDKYPSKLIETIVDPIDLSRFPKQIENDIYLNQQKHKKVLFASVNVNNPIKRFYLAEQSFELLKKELPEVELVIMSNISHDKVYEFMKEMDVLLLTSTHEGWPNVVKEMLSLDKPFVSTNVSDLKKIANQTNSCFVCENNPADLAVALKKSILAPKEDLRKFVDDFSMENSLNAIKILYNKYL